MADDAVFATLTCKIRALIQMIENHAGHGRVLWDRQIHGSKGSMDMPHDRIRGSLMHLIIVKAESDIHLDVQRVPYQKLASTEGGET